MNRYEIEQKFNPAERLIIKRFLTLINDASKDSGFADASDIDELNQFSAISESETDDDIRTNVKEWLRLKKVRLRGNFTNN
jgi:hypothetical protein